MLKWSWVKMYLKAILFIVLTIVVGLLTSQACAQASIQFLNVTNKATIRNNNAIEFIVQAQSDLLLASDAVAQLWVDQELIQCQIEQKQISCKLKGITRGEHRLQIKINRQQQLIATSEKLIVYFQQAHILIAIQDANGGLPQAQTAPVRIFRYI